MKFIKEHEQKNLREVESLINSQTMLGLITVVDGRPRYGLYNFIYRDKSFFIHLGKKDEQAIDLRKVSKVLVTLTDVLSVIPSFWVDPLYGGAINNFFRYAEFQCVPVLYETPTEILPFLKEMLEAYQKERIYQPLETQSPIYREKFAILSVVELKVESMRTKWNLGQTKPREAFLNVIDQLERRGQTLDLRTAQEMKKLI